MPLDSNPHIALTKAFIAENPSRVTIVRDIRVSDGSGGTTVSADPDVLPDQTMRLVGIEPRRGHTLIMTVNRDGEQVMASSTIVAMPDADIQKQDRFYINGDTTRMYEVLHVENHPEWRLRAEVYLHAS